MTNYINVLGKNSALKEISSLEKNNKKNETELFKLSNTDPFHKNQENQLKQPEKIKILLVEDSNIFVQLCLKMLNIEIFDVTHTDTVKSAIAYLKAEKFHLILLDLTLPDQQ